MRWLTLGKKGERKACEERERERENGESLIIVIEKL